MFIINLYHHQVTNCLKNLFQNSFLKCYLIRYFLNSSINKTVKAQRIPGKKKNFPVNDLKPNTF